MDVWHKQLKLHESREWGAPTQHLDLTLEQFKLFLRRITQEPIYQNNPVKGRIEACAVKQYLH